MAAVLDEAASTGIPENHSRWDLGRATALELEERTPYGTLIDSLKLKAKSGGRDIDMPIINPQAFLYRAFSLGGSFSKMLSIRIALFPPSPEAPWRLILYSDEVVPGNPLAHDNRRKVWVIYFSFIEFGPTLLM